MCMYCIIMICCACFVDSVLIPNNTGLCLVELTLHNGREKLGYGKSLFIITILYVSHFFSAWVSTINKYNTIVTFAL